MARPDISAPRKRRRNKAGHQLVSTSGGVAGDQLRRRIARLRDHLRLSKRAFAEKTGVNSRRVTDWERSGRPDVGSLRQIAEKVHVDLYWLLGIYGDDADPMFRDVSRSLSRLADDVAAYVSDEVRRVGDGKKWPADLLNAMALVGDAVLDDMIDGQVKAVANASRRAGEVHDGLAIGNPRADQLPADLFNNIARNMLRAGAWADLSAVEKSKALRAKTDRRKG
ncbi:MAG TPA: helix-turn-helix transcriptional regulator [Gemmatimonadaceae bacterium]|nr:helix-turn-helix transcriptional regulator [Gemmatimonadaceae bacterium]